MTNLVDKYLKFVHAYVTIRYRFNIEVQSPPSAIGA